MMKRVRHLTAVLLPCRQELSCPQTTVCCVAIACYGETSLTMGAFFGGLGDLVRKCVFRAIMVGPMPNHVAFIMDGNRRFAAKQNMAVSDGHRAESRSMMAMLDYIYQLGVKYVTGYAFSIENFKRKPEEVPDLMDIIVDKTKELLDGSLVEKHEMRVYFIGNLGLLSERVQLAAERAMEATAKNSRTVLLICVAYTSSDEIVHAVQESCKGKSSNARIANGSFEESPKEDAEKTSLIKLGEIERNMYMAVAPDPDTVIRNSGETRLSNFLLWQTADSLLYSPAALWLELVYRHLIREMLQYQRSYPYFHRYLS